MKTLLKISFLLMSVAGVCCETVVKSGTNPDGSTWTTWKTTYNRQYDPEEEQDRMNNFMNVNNMVNQHNQEYEQQKQPYSMCCNEFADMSDDEFKNNMMGLENEKNCDNSSSTYKAPDNPDIPDEIDYRDYGYVTPIKNQGTTCGACYAFVAIGSLEGQHKRITGNLVKLSEQNLIDCSREQGNNGCAGGNMCKAFEYATNIPGVDTEESYPYKGTDQQCQYDPKGAGSPVGGYLNIPEGDEQALKSAVGLIGPVAAAFNGNLQNFRYYKDGIFSDPACDPNMLSHALTIIGYGTENGTDYWLVKNSWGESWGQNGIGKVARNQNNMCGIASFAMFPVLHQNPDGSPKLDGPAASP